MGLDVKYYYDDYENIIIKKDKKEYKFIIKKQEAIVLTNDYEGIEEIVSYVKNIRPYVYKFHSATNEYYQEFDIVYSFKLPINIIQPSKFFIDKNIVNEIGDNINEDNVYLPVEIINDEYVLLDGHTRLYCLNQNYIKMVNVYLYKAEPHISDFVYIAKEGNIKNISSIHVLEHDQYELYWKQFLDQFKF